MTATSKIAVCTSLYEAGRPFLDAFVAGLNASSPGQDVMLVAALHGFDDPSAAFVALDGTLPVRFTEVPADASVAEVRCRMLRAAAETEAEYFVLVDMDDYLLPEGVAAHLAAMRDADFSYGDMALIDADGADMGRTFYQDNAIPAKLSGVDGEAAILTRNFLGFSNTAFRRRCLDPARLAIPDDLVAIDWWFYTQLLQDGYTGAKADRPVIAYRTHAGNILGGRARADLTAVRRRLAINRRHCEAFAGNVAFDVRRAALDRLESWIEREDEAVAAAVAAACSAPGVWFDDIARLADRVAAD